MRNKKIFYKNIKKVEVEEDKLLVYDEVGVVYKETAIYNFCNLPI